MTSTAVGDDKWTLLWWNSLRFASVINVLSLLVLASSIDTAADPAVTWQLRLSCIFTFVCAFRSFWPRIDLERYCVVDSFLSSIVIGRSAATVAEISFAHQVAMMLFDLSHISGIVWIRWFYYPIIFTLTFAQVCCWYGVVSLNHLGHAIEESLWAVAFTVVGCCLVVSTPYLQGAWFWACLGSAILSALYVLFMVTVDVPMYLERWRTGENKKYRMKNLFEGFRDALNRRVVTKSWAIWQPEVAWLSGYFTFAVWLSQMMVVLTHHKPPVAMYG